MLCTLACTHDQVSIFLLVLLNWQSDVCDYQCIVVLQLSTSISATYGAIAPASDMHAVLMVRTVLYAKQACPGKHK